MIAVFIMQLVLLLCIMWYVTVLGIYPSKYRPSAAQMRLYISTAMFLSILLIPDIVKSSLEFEILTERLWLTYLITTLAVATLPLLHYHYRNSFESKVETDIVIYWVLITVFLVGRYCLVYLYGYDMKTLYDSHYTSYSQFTLMSIILIYNSITIVVMMQLRKNEYWEWLYSSLASRAFKANFIALLWWFILMVITKQILRSPI